MNETVIELTALLQTRLIGLVRVKDRRILWANQTFAEQFGYTVGELTGQPTRIVYPDDETHAQFAASAFPVIQAGGVYRGEIRQRRKDGTIGWYSVNCALARPGGSEQIGVFIDVTDRKQYELALAEREKHFNAAQRVAQIGSWESDLVTNELKWSEEMCRIFEHDPQGPPPTHEIALARVHPDDRLANTNAYREATARGGKLDFTSRVVSRDGKLKFVRFIGELLFDASGTPRRWIGTAQDVTIPALEGRYNQMIETMQELAFYATRAATNAASAADKSALSAMMATSVTRDTAAVLPMVSAMAAQIASESALASRDAGSAASAAARVAASAAELLGNDFIMKNSVVANSNSDAALKSAAEAASTALAAAEIAKALGK
jgi:PAS domain S-box-containing protein